jgi:glycerophosphoryl diester phosphodiesterase
VLLGALALGGVAFRHPASALPFADLRRPIVFAHRGGGGEAPESTLSAILAAARIPDAAVELDLRRSRDGHIVVIHDRTVDRTTEGTGEVADLDLAQLKALDAGYCATPGEDAGTALRGSCHQETEARFPFRGKGHRIPTLEEVLAAVPAETLIGIEVKEAGFEAQLAAMVRASGRRRIIVGSEDADITARLDAALPEVHRYFPASAAVRFVLGARLAAGYLSWPAFQILAVPRSGGGLRTDTERLVRAAHNRGVFVAYWVVNDEAEMERLFRLGADAIMTDYPARAQRVAVRFRKALTR